MRYRQLTSPITFGITQSIVGQNYAGPLDLVPGAAAAYSTRRLRFGYTGPAVRVRRSSDNAEADIGFDGAGNLDQAALMNHVGYENLFTYSEQFDNAAWTKAGATITANSTTAPNNTLTADTLTTTASTTTYAYQLKTPSGVNTFSIFAKQGTNRYIWVYFGLTNNNYGVLFDLQTGTVATSISKGSVTQASNSISAEANGFYRCSITANVGSAQFYQAFSGTNAIPVTTTNNNDLNNATNGTIFVWGAQLNSGTSAQPYQQTVASAAAGNGLVTTWYDQSGNASHVTQATAAFQPRIVNSGVVNTLNGRPAPLWDNVDDVMYISMSLASTSLNVFAVVDPVAPAQLDYILDIENVRRIFTANGQIFDGTTFNPIIAPITTGGARVYGFTTGPTNQIVYSNGTAVSTLTAIPDAPVGGAIGLGGRFAVGTPASLNGKMAEFTLFPSVLSTADRQTLERNQGAYYGISVA